MLLPGAPQQGRRVPEADPEVREPGWPGLLDLGPTRTLGPRRGEQLVILGLGIQGVGKPHEHGHLYIGHMELGRLDSQARRNRS